MPSSKKTEVNDQPDPTTDPASERGIAGRAELDLRRRAASEPAASLYTDPPDGKAEELQRALHELSVHQAELELQNEELSRAQIALEASRARYFSLYDEAPVGYVTFGLNGVVLEANRLAARMLGVEQRQLAGRRLFDFMTAQQRPIFAQHYEKLLKREGPQSCELRMSRADRTEFWAHLHMMLVLEDSGDTPMCRLALVDVNERVAMQERVARLAAVVASADDAIITRDLDGEITSWNSAAERLLGYTAEEMLGRLLDELLPASHRDEAESLRQARLGGARAHLETQLTAKGGRALPISVSVSPLKDEQGRITGTSLIARDIGDRIRAQEALHRRLRQLDLLSQTGQALIMAEEASPDTLARVFERVGAVIGADVYLSYRLGAIPETLELVSTAGLSEALRERAASIRFGETLSGLVADRRTPVTVEDLLASGLPEAAELHAIGVRCYAGFPLLASGELMGVATFATGRNQGFHEGDLQVVRTVCDQVSATLERLRLLRELRSNEQALKEADRKKDDFIATLAHELRNPLAPIRNAVSILRRASTASELETRLVETMERQVGYMVRLVDDLLEVSRITRGKVDLRTERVELAGIVRNAVEMSRPQIDRGGQLLSIDLPAEPLVVAADAVRLAQVLANLLNNAAKYTDSGGEIRLIVEREGGQVTLCVRDTGCGISPQLLPHIFEMFTQGERGGGPQGGLGIGLTLVRTLVEMHGGSVEARSEGIGSGSEFIVRLPLAPELTMEDAAPRGHLTMLSSPCRILLVDDNRDAADSMANLLRLIGAEVELAYDGPAALEVLERFEPDVVILDIGMPVMDGYEVARRIRQLPKFKDTSLIALTGWGQPEDRLRSRRAGFDHHLVKPADLKELQGLLEAHAH